FPREASSYVERALVTTRNCPERETSIPYMLCSALYRSRKEDTSKLSAAEPWAEHEWSAFEGNLLTIGQLQCEQRTDRNYHESWMLLMADTIRLRYYIHPERIGKGFMEEV